MTMQLNLFKEFSKQENKFLSLASRLDCNVSQSGWPDIFGKNFLQKFGKVKPINTLSIFSGAGGLDIGFHDIGFKILERIEIESIFCKTLRANTGPNCYFSSGITIESDIRNYKPKANLNVDLIIGGPPCQSFSAAGRRANGVPGIHDERGVLFKEYIRLLDQIKPKAFLFENVYGITGAQNGKAWEKIKKGFEEAGYIIFFRILDAADYGVPQHRERLFIVGLNCGKFKFPKPTHGPDSIDNLNFYNAGVALSSLPNIVSSEKMHIKGRFGKLLDDIPPGLNYSFYTQEMGHPQPIFAWRSKFSDFMYKADPDVPVRTIKAQGGQYTGPFHWACRHFTIEEYKRLQTFPDDYILVGNNAQKVHQIGNSVPPQLARILAIAIKYQIFSALPEYELNYLGENEELGFRKRKRLLTSIYREKAKKAIRNISIMPTNVLQDDRTFYVNIGKNFELLTTHEKNSQFYVEKKIKDNLVLCIYDAENYNCGKNTNNFSIDINIVRRNCNIPFNNIKLECTSSKIISFTVAWKLFEKELIDNNIIADLVQLNGYYQYEPNLVCKLLCEPSNEISFLFNIVNGKLTRRIITKDILLKTWLVDEKLLYEKALLMKNIGYEIRNHNTNPQIPFDSWLIPYPFPTLNPLSVQLHKSI